MYRRAFGRSTTAYTNLMQGHESEVTYWTFQRAWSGEKVKPEDVVAIEAGWSRYVKHMADLALQRHQWMGSSEDAAYRKEAEPEEPRDSLGGQMASGILLIALPALSACFGL
jgi:hypothetical protein